MPKYSPRQSYYRQLPARRMIAAAVERTSKQHQLTSAIQTAAGRSQDLRTTWARGGPASDSAGLVGVNSGSVFSSTASLPWGGSLKSPPQP